MFSIQGFLTCKSKMHDELQTPLPNRTMPDCLPYEGQAQHDANCQPDLTPQVQDQPRVAPQCRRSRNDQSKSVKGRLNAPSTAAKRAESIPA